MCATTRIEAHKRLLHAFVGSVVCCSCVALTSESTHRRAVDSFRRSRRALLALEVLQSWRAVCAQRRNVRHMVQRHCAKRQARLMSACFAGWMSHARNHAACLAQQALVARKQHLEAGVAAIQHAAALRLLAAALAAWHAAAARQAGISRQLAARKEAADRRLSAAALLAWCDAASWQARIMRQVALLQRIAAQRLLHAVLMAWRDAAARLATRSRQVALWQRIKGKQRSAAVLHAWRAHAARMVVLWAEIAIKQQARDYILSRAVFAAWRGATQRAKQLRGACVLLAARRQWRLVAYAMDAWHAFVLYHWRLKQAAADTARLSSACIQRSVLRRLRAYPRRWDHAEGSIERLQSWVQGRLLLQVRWQGSDVATVKCPNAA